MAGRKTIAAPLADSQNGPVIARRAVRDTAEMDITPMIDITFLLLIFFLVASTMDRKSSVPLPRARYGDGVMARTSVIITVAERGGTGPALVYLADSTTGAPLPDDRDLQESRIIEAVEKGFREGKSQVLVKAGRGVLHRDVARVATAVGAADVEGVQLHLAVFEID